MSINIHEIADLLHMDEISADIYLELLTHKALPQNKIIAFTGKKEEEVKKAIKILADRDFITTVKNTKGEKVFQALSIMQIEEKMEREKETMKNLKNFILPQIQQHTQLEIMKYEEWEGIRHVYTEILEEAIRTGESIFAFEANLYNSDIGMLFLEKYVEQRIKHKIDAYVLCPQQEADIEYKDKYEKNFTHVKLLKDFSIDANINIVGELVMTFSTDSPRGTLRRNRAEANTFRSVFQKIWKI